LRIWNPLKCASSIYDVEQRIEFQLSEVGLHKSAIRDLAHGDFEQCGIAIDPNHVTCRSHGGSDSGRNCSGAASGIEDGHAGPKKGGELPMIPFEGPAAEDAGVRLMRLCCTHLKSIAEDIL
jgi:hypothetical protein